MLASAGPPYTAALVDRAAEPEGVASLVFGQAVVPSDLAPDLSWLGGDRSLFAADRDSACVTRSARRRASAMQSGTIAVDAQSRWDRTTFAFSTRHSSHPASTLALTTTSI